MPDKRIVNEHPTWFLKSDRPVNPGVMMTNYGNPEALEGITDMVSGFNYRFRNDDVSAGF